MGSKKIVLDTNVFVSALGWKGAPFDIFNGCIYGDFDLFLSTEILDEIIRVLNYPKFKFRQEDIDEFLELVLEIGSLVEIAIKIEKIKEDSSDNKFLECAVTVEADYIISRDSHLLKIKEFKGIKIRSPEVFRQEQ